MQAKLLLVLVIAILPVGSASAPFHVDFSAPAQLEGELAAENSQWLLLVFHDSAEAAFNVSLPAGVGQSNLTQWVVRPTANYDLGGPVALPSHNTTLVGPTQAALDFRNQQWASLILRADEVSVSSSGAGGSLDDVKDGDFIPDHLPAVHVPVETLTAFSLPTPPIWFAGTGASMNAASLGGNAMPVHVHAQGLHQIAWHNTTIACASSSCPEEGKPSVVPVGLGGGFVERLSYIELDSADGFVDGDAMVLGMVAGGPNLDASVHGHLRLPDAALTGTCPRGTCPDMAGRTFSAEGDLEFRHLAPPAGHSGRLEAQLDGHFTSAFFDESPAHGFAAEAAVATVALIGLAWLVKGLIKAVGGLFARSSRPPALQHELRREAYQLIQAEPGLSVGALQRRLGWPIGTLRYHLDRLVDAGLVVRQPYRNSVRFFENHGRYQKTWKKLAPLRDAEAKRLHDWLLANPGLDQTRIRLETANWGWADAKTRRRLQRLLEAGLLSTQAEGRRLRYTAKPSNLPSG